MRRVSAATLEVQVVGTERTRPVCSRAYSIASSAAIPAPAPIATARSAAPSYLRAVDRSVVHGRFEALVPVSQFLSNCSELRAEPPPHQGGHSPLERRRASRPPAALPSIRVTRRSRPPHQLYTAAPASPCRISVAVMFMRRKRSPALHRAPVGASGLASKGLLGTLIVAFVERRPGRRSIIE